MHDHHTLFLFLVTLFHISYLTCLAIHLTSLFFPSLFCYFHFGQSFVVHDDVREYYNKSGNDGSSEEEKWNGLFSQYKIAHPELSADFERRMKGELPSDWKKCLPTYSHLDSKPVATRNRYDTGIGAGVWTGTVILLVDN